MNRFILALKILIKYTFSKNVFNKKTLWHIFFRFFKFYYPYKIRGYYQYINLGESVPMLERLFSNYEVDLYKLIDLLAKPNFVFFDIGSNKGDFSLYVNSKLNNNCQIFCFEPVIENLYYIDKSIRKNKFTNIFLFNFAINSSNKTTFLFKGKRSGTGSLNADFPLSLNIKLPTSTIKLDSFVENYQQIKKIDLIKIDVEGAEADVIKGSLKIIKNFSPTIIIDLHHSITKELNNTNFIFKTLKEEGYSIKSLNLENDINDKNIIDTNSIIAFKKI